MVMYAGDEPKIYEITEEWLESLNNEFRLAQIPHRKRPMLAFERWARDGNVICPSIGDEEAKVIFAWFDENLAANSLNMPPIFVGAFYFDAFIWPVEIRPVIGSIRIDILKSLSNIPNSIKIDLANDQPAWIAYKSYWNDCFRYANSIDHLIDAHPDGSFQKQLLKSGDQDLRGCVTLLLEKPPSDKSIELARMCVEKFLKGYLACLGGLDPKTAQNDIKHDLNEALTRCIEIDPNSSLKKISDSLSIFPEIKDRYEGNERAMVELWNALRISQLVATTVVLAVCRN